MKLQRKWDVQGSDSIRIQSPATLTFKQIMLLFYPRLLKNKKVISLNLRISMLKG